MQTTQNAHSDEVNRLEAEKVDLESELAELRPVKEELDQSKTKLEELESEMQEYRSNSHKIQLYNGLVESAIEDAMYHYRRVNTNASLQQEEGERERLQRIDNYDTIKVWADQYRLEAAKKYRQTSNMPSGANTDPADFDHSRLT